MRVEGSDTSLELPAFRVCRTWKSQARKGSRATQNSKVSMCVQEGAGVLHILPSSQVCPLQGKQGDLERRDQSRTHCAHTHPSLRQHFDWLKGDQTQQARTDGELLRRHMGVHVGQSAHGQTEITKTDHMEMLTRQKACCHILPGTKPRCFRSQTHA